MTSCTSSAEVLLLFQFFFTTKLPFIRTARYFMI